MQRFKDVIRGWLGRESIQTPAEARAHFRLCYGELPVVDLSVKDGVWTLRYTDEFRSQDKLRPLVEFPDVNRTYASEELWPSFSMRIPSLQQSSIRRIVDREKIDETDEVELLRRFGRRSIANPFELCDCSEPVEA